MVRRLPLLLTTLAVAAVTVAPASAAPPSPAYVDVWVDESGAHVRSGLPGQPLVNGDAGTDGACVGFSLQVPFCVDAPDITHAIGTSQP
jgi:hypothetical protein